MRPPHRALASSMVTRLPARASSRAVIRAAAPAPTTTKCVRCCAAIDYLSHDRAQTEPLIADRGRRRVARAATTGNIGTSEPVGEDDDRRCRLASGPTRLPYRLCGFAAERRRIC